MLNAIERSLVARADHRSWAILRKVLATHCIVNVAFPTKNGHELRIRRDPKPEQEHEKIYPALNVGSQIMKPTKYWSEKLECRD